MSPIHEPLPRLKWPGRAEIKEAFRETADVSYVVKYEPERHLLKPARQRELLSALDRTGAQVVNLDLLPGDQLLSRWKGHYDAPVPAETPTPTVAEEMRATGVRVGFHLTDRLTYSVLRGHWIMNPLALPDPEREDDLDADVNEMSIDALLDEREVGRKKGTQLTFEGLFFMARSLTSDDPFRADISSYMSGGDRMARTLTKMGIRLDAAEQRMTEDFVLLGVDLKGFEEYERRAGVGGFVELSDGKGDFDALLAPPLKFVKPLAILSYEEPIDLSRLSF